MLARLSQAWAKHHVGGLNLPFAPEAATFAQGEFHARCVKFAPVCPVDRRAAARDQTRPALAQRHRAEQVLPRANSQGVA